MKLVIPIFLVFCLLITPCRGEDTTWTHDDLETIVKELIPEVETLRGIKFKTPITIGLLSAEEMIKTIEDILQQEMPDEEIEKKLVYLTTMGLLKEKIDLKKIFLDILREQVAGFYNQYTGKLYIVDRQLPFPESLSGDSPLLPSGLNISPDSLEGKIVLVHEMTHALQDQHFDIMELQKKREKDDDRTNAFQAVMEGDALLAMLLYGVKRMGVPEDLLLNMADFMDEMLSTMNIPGMETFMKAPEYLKKQFLFGYIDGMRFVQTVHGKKGWAGVNHLYSHLPVSTEQVIHPERYIDLYDTPVKILIPEQFEDNYTFVTGGTAGELDLKILFNEYSPKESADAASEGWDGDRYEIYRYRQENDFMMRWVLVFDTPEDAGDCYNMFKEIIPVIHSNLDLISSSDYRKKTKWKKGNRIYAVEQQNDQVRVVYNISRSLYFRTMRILRDSQIQPVQPDQPVWESVSEPPREEIREMKPGSLFPVDFSKGMLKGLRYSYPEEDLALELPSEKWHMKVSNLGNVMSMLSFFCNGKNVTGTVQIIQFPIPLSVQNLAMSLEMSVPMLEKSLKATKIRSRVVQLNKEYAFELILQKKELKGGPGNFVQQVYLPRTKHFLLVTIFKPTMDDTELENELTLILNSINRKEE